MGQIKISELIPKNAPLSDNDLLMISQETTDGFESKSITGAEIIETAQEGLQRTLVSGTNIKTVNSNSLLGSGDVAVQPTLVSGTNIKTINGTSLLGSGNLTIGGGSSGINNFIKPQNGDSTSAHVVMSSLSSLTLVNTRLYANPFISAQTITSSSLYVNCVTAQAGALGRILIYSDLNGLPNTKIFESSNLDLSTTGIKSVITAQTFNAGTTYWLSFHSSGTSAISGIPSSAVIPIRISNINISSLLFTSATFGSAPSPFGSATFTNTAVPFIGITL
jgi:hypothetical protein